MVGMVNRGVLALLFLLAGPAAATGEELGGRLREHVTAIAAAERDDRASVIRERLGRMGISSITRSFDGGENLEIRFAAAGESEAPVESVLVLGAHLDRVAVGQGAVDNGASCAILIELARSLGERPPPVDVLLLFFDREEDGLRGSRAWVRDHGEALRSYRRVGYLNLDINAYGDTIFFGPHPRGGRLPALVRLASRREGLEAVGSARYPPSDNLSFSAAGLESISVAILPAQEVRDTVTLLSGRGGSRPAILGIIQSPRDRVEHVDPQALIRVLRLAERILALFAAPLEYF